MEIEFDPTRMTRATSEDIFRIYRQLWEMKSIEQTGVDNMPNISDECLNCGGEYGLHHCSTDRCPVGGREAPVGRKQEWETTTFQAAPKQDAAQVARIAELEAQNKRLVEVLGTTNAALIITASDLSLHGGYAGKEVFAVVDKTRALLAELSK